MIGILVAADREDKDFLDGLCRLLDRHFATVRAVGGRLSVPERAPSLLLCDIQCFEEIDAGRVIVVYKRARPLTARITGADQVVAVVDSSDDKLLAHVSDTQLPAITCGMQSRDTITLSSMGEDSAMIDIQRTIPCFDGVRAEPQEIPVRFDQPLHRFSLMTMAAVMLLSGNREALLKGKL